MYVSCGLNSSDRPRQGFTLLEVTLALAISVVLLSALYTAFFILVRQTQSGRELVERSQIVQAVMRQMRADIGNHLAPIDTRVIKAPASWQLGLEEDPAATLGMEPAPADGSDPAAAEDPAVAGTAFSVFSNYGVVGDSKTLSIYCSNLPFPARLNAASLNAALGEPRSDLHRICYWVASDNTGVLGLARKEYKVALSEEALQDTPWSSGEIPNIIAEQIRDIEFFYFDSDFMEWVSEWDGSAVGADGKSPIGPPAAIRVVLYIGDPLSDPNGQSLRTMNYVIAIPTANGWTPADLGAGLMAP